MASSIWTLVRRLFKQYIYLGDDIDTESAAQRIKGGIWFRGPVV